MRDLGSALPVSPRTRSLLIFGAKAAVAAVLLGWLIRSHALDFAALGLFFERPWLLIGNLVLSVFNVLFGALRWSVLLRLAGVRMPLGRALQLQMTALFFNVVIPGNVGGDVLKAVYAAREAEPSKRPTVFLIVFVERLLGLAGLVLIAGVVTLWRGPALWQDPRLRDLSIAVAVLAGVTLIAPAIVLVAVRRSGNRLESWTGGSSRLAKIANRLVLAARLVSADPAKLAISLTLSMALHGGSLLLFTALAQAITHQDVPLSAIASVFPLGTLTLILPISPAGIGVGHVAFDRLFTIIGLSGGANVFNLFLVGQVAPQLLGVFPYLGLRREGTLPTEAPAPP